MAKNKQQIKFEADISGFKSAIKESEKHISSLNKELKLNAEQLKGNSKNVDLLQNKLKELQTKYEEQSNVVENTSKALETAKETFGENSEEARKWKDKLTDAQTAQEKIKNAIEETNVQLKQQTNGWITHGKSLEQTGDKIEKLGDKLNSLGNKVSIVSAGVAATIIAVSKAAIDYESAFAGVVKTVDGTEEQLKAINDGILDMSTRMPAAATEIAGVAESAGQLGIKTDDILNFTEVMINLGESTNLSADEAASALAKFANITNMSADDYGKLGSVIVDLGNNFATTEADIVSMATRLAATGELTGLSQSQIMALAAAMSSVGIEAEAGGSAMSKLLKRIQVDVETGSDELKEFAKVAGVSTSEFKKAFQDDAVNALSMFLAGLQDTERNGKSAIAILDDLDIKEVRLSNTVLSLSNAHEVLSDAVKTANNAWDANTALQNEVDKRYATTESQMKMLKNEATKLAIEFGNELAPTLRKLVKDAKPLLQNIAQMIKKFGDLDAGTKQNIIKFGLLVSAAGPVIKTLGSITSTTGTVIKTFGNLTSKLGGSIAKLTATTTAVSGLSLAFGGLGIAAAAIVAGDIYVTSSLNDMFNAMNLVGQATFDLAEKTKTQAEAYEATKKARDDSLASGLNELDQAQKLQKELNSITDANGKVKEGYEKRAEFIVGKLSEALGIEIKMTDGVIDKYGELNDTIDSTIRKKKSGLIMDSLEESYKEATKNINSYKKELDDALSKAYIAKTAYENHEGTLDELNAANQAVSNARVNVRNAQRDIANYNYATKLYAEGTIESLDQLNSRVAYSTNNVIDMTDQGTKEALDNSIAYLNDYKKLYEESQDEAFLYQIDIQQKEVQSVAEHLLTLTSTTEENSQAVVDAWKDLAADAYDQYYDFVSVLPEDQRKTIEKMTGVTAEKTPELVEATKIMSQEVVDQLDKDADFRKNAVENLQAFLNGLEDDELRELLEAAGTSDVEKVMKGIRAGNLAESEGVSILKNLKNGLGNPEWTDKLFGKARSIASSLSSMLKVTASISSTPKTSNADGLAYVPYNGYIARLHEGERVLTKSENADYMANKISNNNNNVNVSIYTQTLTEGELERVSRYIEKKWGGKS